MLEESIVDKEVFENFTEAKLRKRKELRWRKTDWVTLRNGEKYKYETLLSKTGDPLANKTTSADGVEEYKIFEKRKDNGEQLQLIRGEECS